ncbi:amino acid permease [Kitasatospora saccharophila]|uniref:Amino acid permease n=1 Tax=Kitasatospora saccharophila TaxID=407973 RepID=A0ABN2WYP4_9ACTN
MTTSTTSAPPAAARGAADYPQQLHRTIGRFGSFAAGFSFISVLTTVFQLFAFGYGAAGPAFVWTWPVVLLGQLLVAACFAELAARHPFSGAIYQWASRMAGPVYGWFTGWLMVLGQVVVVAAAALALQVVLPALWSGFQLLGGDPSPTTASGAANAVLLGAALIALTTFLNSVDNRVLTLVNGVGVSAEILGIALIVVALFSHAEQSPGALLHTAPDGGGGGGGGWALLVGAFTAAYVMIGFDSAGELSEETLAPRRTAPRTILTALAAAGLSGGLLLLGGVLAAPSLTDGRLAAEGLPYVLTSRLGDGLGRVLLADVAVAVCVGTLAMQTAGARMVFSMARDGALPGSRRLAAVAPGSGTPRWAALAVGVPAVGFLLLNLAAPAAFVALSSTCVALVYAAYALVVGAVLVRRLRGLPLGEGAPATDETGRPLFSLGRWGLPVNAAALLYGVAMTVDLAWPRAAVYDPEGGHWYLRWFALLTFAAALALGAAYRLRRRRR